MPQQDTVSTKKLPKWKTFFFFTKSEKLGTFKASRLNPSKPALDLTKICGILDNFLSNQEHLDPERTWPASLMSFEPSVL